MPERKTWHARGYQVIAPDKPKFEKGDYVIIERPSVYSKNILEELLVKHYAHESDLVKINHFHTKLEEHDFVINEISRLINIERVEPEEILVITLDTKKSEPDFKYIRSSLNNLSIKCITPGFIEESHKFKEQGRVTLSTPFRAKGNESNIVFVIGTNKIDSDYSFRVRNAFFVAVTRSRGWCYITSSSYYPSNVVNELNSILQYYPRFEFYYPDIQEYNNLTKIIMTSDDKLNEYEKSFENILSDEVQKAVLLDLIKNNPQLAQEVKRKLDE